MVVKVYVSGISGNKEVKKHQQRVLMILDSKCIEYEVVDIAEPGKESEKNFMQQNSNAKNSKHPLPPQMFNEEAYCGDYEEFDLANETDELEVFLKMEKVSRAQVNLQRRSEDRGDNGEVNQNGVSSREASAEKEAAEEVAVVAAAAEDAVEDAASPEPDQEQGGEEEDGGEEAGGEAPADEGDQGEEQVGGGGEDEDEQEGEEEE